MAGFCEALAVSGNGSTGVPLYVEFQKKENPFCFTHRDPRTADGGASTRQICWGHPYKHVFVCAPMKRGG